MAEQVELHGGPRHGEFADVPFDGATAIEIVATFNVKGSLFQRRGRYTRVFSISNKPEKLFEFIGYTTAYQPVETDA